MWQIVINGPGYFDTAYDLADGVTFVGRGDNNDIVLSGDAVSRRHARIEVAGSKFTVEDQGSRNGTKLNGARVEGPFLVKSGDTVGIGENNLAVRTPSAGEVARTELVNETHPPLLDAAESAAPPIAGQVLVTRGIAENPFVTSLDKAQQFTSKQLSESQTVDGALQEFESLFLLFKVSEKLTTAPSLNRFLEDVIDLTTDVAMARTGIALLKDERGRMVPMVVRHAGSLAQGEVPISDGVVAEVVAKKVSLLVNDARDDARFASRESVMTYGLNQLICVPMIRSGELIGVIYLARDTKAGGIPPTRIVDLVTAIAHMAAVGVEGFRLKEKVQNEERVRKVLERFHAPAVVERVIADIASGNKVGHMEPKEATVMFADITGFTALTERVPPERVVDLLNEFYARMTRVIFSFDGTVDKFIGDSVMSVFGAPYSRPDDASRAVRCALAARHEFVEMMTRRPAEERCGIKIGLNTGKVLAGTLGSEARWEYTALGDAVNVASRLQGSAEPGQILITGKTLAATGARFDVAPLGERELRGKREKVPVFEVLDEDSEVHTSPGV